MTVLRRPALLGILLLLAACSPGGGGGALQARFEAGNEAYEEGEYEKASDIYREVKSSGLDSTALHYNLGNALFKTGRLGEAILEYERALRLSPGDEDCRENLEYLRGLAIDEILPASTPLGALGITYVLELTSPGQDAGIMAVAWLAAGVAFGAGMLGRGENLRRSAFYVAGALALPALLAGASLGTKSYLSASGEYGIVLSSEVEVLSGAGEENPALFTVHEGLKVRIRSRAGDWAQVSLANGLTGWLPAESFEAL